MDDLSPSDLKTILHSKRANLYYLEYCRVMQKDGRVLYLTEAKKENLYFNIPIANTTVILLGNGASITQSPPGRPISQILSVNEKPRTRLTRFSITATILPTVLPQARIPHGFAVMHGKTRRGALVFDVADLVKDAVILPWSFICAKENATEQEFRQQCLQAFSDHGSLDFMFNHVKTVALQGIEPGQGESPS